LHDRYAGQIVSWVADEENVLEGFSILEAA
jgi:hypothetical protein